MDEDRYFAAIEAVLFATGRAVSKADLARALEISAEEAGKWAASFMEAWNRAPHGTEVVALEDAFQMCTRADYFPELIRLELKPQTPRLTDALLETLSVIAYKQPVTKGEIERIRGVNSDHAVNRLIEYRLVTELGRAKLPGRPILLGTTEEFLRVFGVSSRDSLPEISPALKDDLLKEAENEAGVVV